MIVTSQELTSCFEDIPDVGAPNIDLVLVQGNPYTLQQPALLEKLCTAFPNACIAGCSSAGEILNGEAFSNSIVYSAIDFKHSTVRQSRVNLIENQEDDFEAGKTLAKQLEGDDLVAIIIYSEGLSVDCDELIKGMHHVLGSDVALVGGLAADHNALEYTVVMDRQGVYDDAVVAVAIYGKRIQMNCHASDYNQEGIDVDITASDANIIYQINQQPALEVYEDLIYQQSGLRLSSGLYHPLVILDAQTKRTMYYRTISGYDIESNSVICAGSVPEGPARLISLVDFEEIVKDVKSVCRPLVDEAVEFALVVSCAGRKDVMGSKWKEEGSIIQKFLGDTPSFGFYSYGEIGKSNTSNASIVHNHTLTIATFFET